jgi:serine/threonine protein kinase/tetratricopeptide (TPR) repeat protein
MGGAKLDEKSIFNAARRIGSAEARRRYLARACEGDPALRTRVEALLRVYHEDGGFLRTPVLGVGNPFADPEHGTGHAPGTVIGPYTLADRLGEGGMGVVYLADQAHPVRRQVALKIVRPEMDTGQIVARFEAEREALALMDHPNIARVLDAGVTPPGRPYFVMELVRGVPITRYCDGDRLPLRDRLRLFAQVCRGVQHAHQKGVIHRDLKPSNVLVTVVDGKPVPKIIDFGLAKVIGRKPAEGTLLTRVGVVVGTPDYMSPEQADPGRPDIDTRSDVYALGVLLYELLTGLTPLSRDGEDGRLADVLSRIREEEPARPSARLKGSPELAAVAAARGAEPLRLVGLVRGDLDWIVMRCLEKDRVRRYESADGLARDVERHLRHEAVEASPPSPAYRLKKFARRHRAALATAAGFVLLLAGGAAVGAWQAVRATTAERAALEDCDRAVAARRQAQRALNKLTDDAVERLMARQGRLTEEDREFLRQVLSLHEEFAGTAAESPETRAAVAAARFRVGVIRYRLGEFREAEEAYRGAIDIRRALADEFPGRSEYRRDLALSHVRLGALLRETGRPRPAEEAFTTAVGISRTLADEFPGQADHRRDLAAAHNHLGNVLLATGRPKEAEAALRAAVDILVRLSTSAPATAQDRYLLAGSWQNLGILLFRTDRAGPAEECYLKARDLFQVLADEFPGQTDYRRDRAQHFINLGVLYADTRRQPEAEGAFRASADAIQKLADEYPTRPEYRKLLASSRVNLGNLLIRMERHEAAGEAYLAARDAYARLTADYPAAAEYQHDLAKALAGLASVKSFSKDHAASARLVEQALAHDRAALRVEPANPAYREAYRIYMAVLAEVYGRAGDHAKAADAADELARFGYEPAADAYTAAWVAIRCAGTAQRDERLTGAERERLAESYADRAVAHLQAALRHGLKDGARLRRDPAFEALHPRDDFRKLLRDIDAAGRP